jgi:Flp pilus assembly protein TadG
MMQRKRRTSGHAVIETALMAPWIFLLFIAIFDFGFYAYAGIVTSNAARVAALYTSTSVSAATDSAGACAYVLEEMRSLPNVGSGLASCSALPLQVWACASGGGCAFACPAAEGGGATTACVKVTYESVPLFPIPGLTGRLTINRIAQMRAKVN